MVITGKTTSGFSYAYDSRLRDDWRILTAIADTESEDASVKIKGTTSLVRLFLGTEGEAKLISHIASKNDGYVPTSELTKELVEMLQGSAKNS